MSQNPSQHFRPTESGRELELKLRLDPAGARKLRRSPMIAAKRIGRAKHQELVSTYFDTADRALDRDGWRLRVRKAGDRHVQTLKSQAPGLLGRLEWETEVAGPAPEPALLAGGSGQSLPDGFGELEALEPVFTSAVRRTAWLLRAADGSAVELVLDEGEIRVAGVSRPVCEAELELKSGTAAALYDLAGDLFGQVSFRLDPHAKSDRGFALAARREGESVRAQPAPLDPSMSVEAAFKTIAHGCQRHAALNEDCALVGKDPEGVHQLRVALRRLRSAFTLFRAVLPPEGRRLAGELKWLAGALGPARDWDVFVTSVVEPLGGRLPDDPALIRFAGLAAECRAAGYHGAREALLSPRCTRLWLDLGRWLVLPWEDDGGALASPIGAYANALLERRWRKLRKAGRDHDRLTVPELHDLRILAKRLRYAGEFFRGLYKAKAANRHLAALARLQDVLGVLNDSDVGTRLLDEAQARAATAADEPWFARTRALVEGWYAAQTQAEMRRLGPAWDVLAQRGRYWNKPAPTSA
jgi:triphosphatase